MSKDPYPSETADRFIVRFPDGMRDAIKKAAAENNRSMNAEIIHRLEASFGGVNIGVPTDELAALDFAPEAIGDEGATMLGKAVLKAVSQLTARAEKSRK